MAKDKPALKVKPGKKEDNKGDIRSKAKLLILEHPEVLNNARHYFRNENGKTIVEKMVPRGDPEKEDVIMPRNQGDLKDNDLLELAVFALSLVDDTLRQYDKAVAYEDALQRAIGSKDGGKYAGKINASTFALIIDYMGKSKKASDETLLAELGPSKVIPVQASEPIDKSTKESGMDRETILREIKATEKKLAALKVLAGYDCECDKEPEDEERSKEAAETFKCPDCGTKVLARTGYCVKCKKKVKGGEKKEENKDKDSKDEKGEDKENKDNDATTSITASLDEIASVLEQQGDPELMKIAFQIDMVSDVLEGKKEASTLEGDPDEKYMKQFFHAGALERDADEPYMAAFNVDKTTELKDKFQHKQLGKDASAMPYKIVK